jgi:iron-regulated transporter 1
MASPSSTGDERTPLLDDHAQPDTGVAIDSGGASNIARVPEKISRRLYTSHFLSTWNSRVFEFGSVLYLAAVFPGTLLPLSVYALTRGLSAILLSSFAGQYIDRGNRLQVVRLSIGRLALQVTADVMTLY